MVITLIILLPITAVLSSLVTLYAVYMGLKWNYQLKVEQSPPSSPLPSNPVEVVANAIQEHRSHNVLSEWLNGPEKKGSDDS